jgi:hypothetical protein
MNYYKVLSSITPYQQLCVALFLIMASFGTGYTVSQSSHSQNMDNQVFDPFSNKVPEVDDMMQNVIAHPNPHNTLFAHNALVITYGNWADREQGKNKEAFKAYLDECLNVVDTYSTGSIPDLSEMERLKKELMKNTT